MKILALETSTRVGSIALCTATELLAEYQIAIKTGYADMLFPAIEQMLHTAGTSPGEIGAFAVAEGPGSFTALRIGMSVVKGLSLATNRPIIPVSSLDGLAHNMVYANCLVCPLLDARRSEVYTAFYRKTGTHLQRLTPDRTVRPEILLDEIHEDVIFLGDGSDRYRALIGSTLREKALFAPLSLNYPRASAIAQLAFQKGFHHPFSTMDSITPHYGRLPEAEIKWEKGR